MRWLAVPLLLVLSFVVSGCKRDAEPEASPPLSSAETPDPEPVLEAAKAFVIAQEGAMRGGAPTRLEAGGLGALPAGFSMGAPSISGNEATIVLGIEEDGTTSDVRLELLREEERWAVRRTVYRTTPDAPALTMYWKLTEHGGIMFDLDAAQADTAPSGGPLVTITNDTPEGAFRSGSGGSAGGTTVPVNRFSEFGFSDRAEFDSMWRLDLQVADRPAGEVLAELVEGIDVEFDPPRDAPDFLNTSVTVDRRGLTLLEAIDEVCKQAGGYADFGKGYISGLGSHIRVERGARPGLVGYVGPFFIELVGAHDALASDATSLRLNVYALGIMWPGIAAKDRDLIQIEAITDENGRNLLDTAEYDPWNAKVHGDEGILKSESDLPLVPGAGEARVVGIQGRIRTALLTEVQEVYFGEHVPGQRQQAGDLEIVWSQSGVFEVVGAGRDFGSERIKIEIYDTDEALMPSAGTFFSRFGTTTHVSIGIENEPSSAILQVVTRSGHVEYPLDLRFPAR